MLRNRTRLLPILLLPLTLPISALRAQDVRRAPIPTTQQTADVVEGHLPKGVVVTEQVGRGRLDDAPHLSLMQGSG